MKPLSAIQLSNIVSGTITHGQPVMIHYGAYRLKQIKHKNTVLFIEQHIVNWSELASFFPLVLVTEWRYSSQEIPAQVTVIQVKNSNEAMWKFIQFYRSQFQLPVIAITGTAGKTTTKEIIKHILSPYKTLTATQLSTNSRTAHFPYLLSIEEETEVAIFETAVGAPGDLTRAGRYFQPTIGIITNIGEHHLDHCKTLEGYIEAKGEMLDIIHRDGTLIINADDTRTKTINFQRFQGKLITIGIGTDHDFSASNVSYSKNGMQFTLHHKGMHYHVQIPGFGLHQVYNALAAIAAVVEVGISIPQAISQLQTFRKLNKQLQLFKGVNDAIILDDTWSITTTSLEAALKVLKEIAKGKKTVAIIGTITDVGQWGIYIHEQAAQLITDHQVDVLITIGMHAKIIADHSKKIGFKGDVHSFNNSILAYDFIKTWANRETIFLVKGDMYSKTMFELASKLKKKS
jgi:UDP-N-acetylmuramoyl-tripeptide--D-alanyl-D-alanine ligase